MMSVEGTDNANPPRRTENTEAIGPIDLSEARVYVRKLALEAGEILNGYLKSGAYVIEQKGDFDIVTQADTEVEAFVREGLLKKYPGSKFLGEETAPEHYPELRQEKALWVVDPIDGTINFSRGNPHFAISIALVTDSKPVLGIVHLPVLGETYSAQADKEGAYRNDLPIQVSKTGDLSKAVLEADSASGKRREMLEVLETLLPLGRIQVMGSAVTAMAYVAKGTVDGYIHPQLKSWDVAAVGLLIERAGGKVTTLEGKTWDVFEPTILATNGTLHESILELLHSKNTEPNTP